MQLVYTSSAAEPMDSAALAELLRQCRRNNERLGLTGLLLYHDGNFMQVLEGPADAVEAVQLAIVRDRRHCDVTTLLNRPVAERLFGNWSMAFQDASALTEEERAALSTFLREPHRGNVEPQRANWAMALLLDFKRRLR
jgi:hypothetical protein